MAYHEQIVPRHVSDDDFTLDPGRSSKPDFGPPLAVPGKPYHHRMIYRVPVAR